MLQKLGTFVEQKPWMIITIIIVITILFASLLPSLEFKTDFNDFYPDDELTAAYNRMQEYIGLSELPLFVLIEKQQTSPVLSSQTIRDIYYIEQELKELSNVNTTLSIVSFLNPICLVEFGKDIENCSDEQIQIAVEDLLSATQTEELQVFERDDPNEPIDYVRFPRLSRGESVDSADIKNCYISKDNESMTFTFEVYDLSGLEDTLKPSFTKVNVMEWFLGFENLIKPDERLDISYQISAHIEPIHPLWEIGQGFIKNIKSFIENIRNRELTSYKIEAYLWIKPPQQDMYFPLPLETGEVMIDPASNKIQVTVSKEELGQYGIATHIGAFELPAKLSDFTAGVRYYQLSPFLISGGRVVINTSFLFNRLDTIQNRPILGRIATRILENYGDLNWQEFDDLFLMMEGTNTIPETIALYDFENTWTYTDVVPDQGMSNTTFLSYPYLFDDLQLSAIAFLSGDYKERLGPSATLLIIQLDLLETVYQETLQINRDIEKRIAELDQDVDTISLEITGELIVSSQIEELTSEANQLLGPAMFVIIILILFISFRKTSYVLLSILALSVSTIWLLGTMVLLGIAFNVIAVALIPLILGLGVDYSVHLFHNYRAEIQRGNTPGEAVKRSISDVGGAIFLAWLTTVIAFMSFLSSNILPIRQFGILLAVGVSYTFITAITLTTSLRYILDRKKIHKTKNSKSIRNGTFSLKNIMGTLASFVLCHRKKIVFILIVITLLFGSAAVHLEKGFDINQFIPADNPAMELFTDIAEYFPYASEYQEYILIEGDIATVACLKGIAQTHQNIEDDTLVTRNTDGSIKVSSLYSVIQNAIKNNRSLLEKFNIDEKTNIPQTDSDVKALLDYLYSGSSFSLDFDQIDTEALASAEISMVVYKNNSNYEATIISYYIDASFQLAGGNLQDDLETLNREINEDIATYGNAQAIATGMSLIQLNNTNNLTSNQILTTGFSLLLAGLVLILFYRSPSLGIITMIPVCISMVWILGTMFYFGYILDIMTVMVTSITVGIGIDYAIHATERFRLVADKTGDIDQAVCETISHTGGALLIAALTTALSFGILILAPIPPQQRFGIILAVTIIYSFLTSVLFLPLFLEKWAQWRKKRLGYIISPSSPKKEK